jgi:hypothetical protein
LPSTPVESRSDSLYQAGKAVVVQPDDDVERALRKAAAGEVEEKGQLLDRNWANMVRHTGNRMA